MDITVDVHMIQIKIVISAKDDNKNNQQNSDKSDAYILKRTHRQQNGRMYIEGNILKRLKKL